MSLTSYQTAPPRDRERDCDTKAMIRLVLHQYLSIEPRFVSNIDMENMHDTEHRLTELEIKAGFMEDLVDSLNQVVVRQQQQIDALLREVRQLRDQQPEAGSAPFRSLRDELPPHY